MLNFITDYGKDIPYGLTCRKIHQSVNRSINSYDMIEIRDRDTIPYSYE